MREPRDYIIMGTIIVVVIAWYAIVAIRRARRLRKDPFIRADPGHAVAVDLTLPRLLRFQPNDPDPLSARIMGVRDSDPTGALIAGPWNRASLLSKHVKRQVFTSSLVINETRPNLRISDKAELEAAIQAMMVNGGYYRFVLPQPLPLIIRESAGGIIQLDEDVA